MYTWPGLLVYMIIGGFEDALHPDSARLSIVTPDWNWDGVLVYAKIKYCTIKRILYYFKN